MPESLQIVESSAQLHTESATRGYQQLTISEIGLILEWHDKGVPQVEIAQRLGKNQSSISRLIAKLGTDSSPIAKRHFQTRAYRSAIRMTRIAEKGKDDDAIKAARVVLAAAGVVAPVANTPSSTFVVQIGIQGQPVGQDNLSAVLQANSIQVNELTGEE